MKVGLGHLWRTNMTCQKCKKDHKVANTGPLTVCENNEYRLHGAAGKRGNENVRGFGIGQNRFQFPGIK